MNSYQKTMHRNGKEKINDERNGTMGDSKINWTDKTWNPICGCSKASPGCENCYAERQAASGRLQQFERYQHTITDGKWNGRTYLVESVIDEPLRWKKPRTIFVCSMSDLFHESVPFEWIDRVFSIMATCPQHTFIVLTKRPARMREYVSSAADRVHHRTHFERRSSALVARGDVWPLPNVVLGVTAENQAMADERIPILLDTPAAKRFISIEPMIGPVDLRRFSTDVHCLACSGPSDCNWEGYEEELQEITPGAIMEGDDPDEIAGACPKCGSAAQFGPSTRGVNIPKLDGVIVGGEIGPGARPMHPDWAILLRNQCRVDGVPFFFKQWGEWAVKIDRDIDDPDWRENYSVQSPTRQILNFAGGQGFHGSRVCLMCRHGKQQTGRELEGRTHDALPWAVGNVWPCPVCGDPVERGTACARCKADIAECVPTMGECRICPRQKDCNRDVKNVQLKG